jgi:DNA repair protein RadC
MEQSTDVLQFWKDLKSGRFASMVKESSRGRSVHNAREVYHIMKPLFTEEDDVEKIYFVFLDAKNKVLAIENLFTGSINSSMVYVREIVKRIIFTKSSSIIVMHNHPSGSTSPSPEDLCITHKIGFAAASVDVTLHDHIIVGDGFYSMADNGFIREISEKVSSFLKGLSP